MIAKDSKDIQGLREIGRIVALVRDELARQVRPGITTRSLDEQARDLLTQEGALSAPMTSYDFPGYTCISVNEVACHGVPDDTPLQSGDYVNIDVSASKDGYYADTGMTVIAGEADLKQADMLRALGIAMARLLRRGVEKFVDGEAEAEHRKRGADPGHQGAIGGHDGALCTQIGWQIGNVFRHDCRSVSEKSCGDPRRAVGDWRS